MPPLLETAVHWPDVLDELERAAEAACDPVEDAGLTVRHIGRALSWLIRASEAGSHILACQWAGEAAGALETASTLAPGPYRAGLLDLSERLIDDLDTAIGHPDSDELAAVSDEAERILTALGGMVR